MPRRRVHIKHASGLLPAALLASTLLACALTAKPALAQTSPGGQCSVAYWSGNRNLDDQAGGPAARCQVSWRPRASDTLRFGLAARAGWGDAGAGPHRAQGTGHVSEAHVDYSSGPWSARVGRQIISWGRADRINPTDSFGPRDHTLLAADDEAQRLGVDAALLRHDFSDALALVAVLARLAPDIRPQGSMPPQLTERAPSQRRNWAIKLDHSGGIDASLSYFDGHAAAPRYSAAIGPTGLAFTGQHERVRTLGADFATALQAWTLRGEIARSTMRPDCGGCTSPRRRTLQAVLGADRDFGDGANINLQWFSTWRSGEPGAALPGAVNDALDRLNLSFGPRQTGMTLRLSQRLLNERLKIELATLWDFSHHSRWLRPRLQWAHSDALRFGAGLDRLSGPAQSLFGSLRRNNTGFVDMTLVF